MNERRTRTALAASCLKTQSSRFCAMPFRCLAARCCAATVGNEFAHAIPDSNASKKRDAQDEGRAWLLTGLFFVLRLDKERTPPKRG
jgi:hypothetical protein